MTFRIFISHAFTQSEKFIIDSKLQKIINELTCMNIGNSTFILSPSVSCTFDRSGGYSYFRFDMVDNNNALCPPSDNDIYSAKAMLLINWDKIKKQIGIEKDNFESALTSIFSDVSYTREDGFQTLFKAYYAGLIDINDFIHLPDLTESEKLICIQNGFGYDLYNESPVLTDFVKTVFKTENELDTLIDKWAYENPEKCMKQRSSL